MKNWLGWKTGGPPTKLVIEGELKSKPKELADCMNNFFVNKVTNLRNTIPPCSQDPLDRVKEIMKNRTCSFKLESVHSDEIKEIINNMKYSESCGLKLVSDELTPSITHIVNLSITRNNFPSLWKTSKVIPLFKKEDATLPKNYRPVSLLPMLSKILE